MVYETISVIGLGYIGLPTAALLAGKGFRVLGTDISPSVVATINEGRIHIVEPDLDAFVKNGVASGRLSAFTEPQSADVYMICVPTPFRDGGGVPQPNLDYVHSAARAIAPLLKAGDLIILESTSPVGTTEGLHAVLDECGIDTDTIHLAYCPERVLPGKIIRELVENDRIVGGSTPQATRIAADFYATFVEGQVLETDARTAEMCKLTENSFRDVNIAFANELSMICDKEGIDVQKLIALANHHPRVNILQPGAGVGGHCIAVDPWFIVARQPGTARIIRAAREINNHKTDWVIDKVLESAAAVERELGRKPQIACMGLAFKPDIDDLRESPALAIAKRLAAAGENVVGVEPHIDRLEGLPLTSLEGSLESADLFVFLVRHSDFLRGDLFDRVAPRPMLDFCGVAN